MTKRKHDHGGSDDEPQEPDTKPRSSADDEEADDDADTPDPDITPLPNIWVAEGLLPDDKFPPEAADDEDGLKPHDA